MKTLEIKRLSADGYVIAVEPPLVREQATESITVNYSYKKGRGAFMRKVMMVKIYHDRIITILKDGGFDEYLFSAIFEGAKKGEIVVRSTNKTDVWYVKWTPSLTGIVRYLVSDAGTADERWQDQEAVIFVGMDHGCEEVLCLEADGKTTSDLYDLIPQYAKHYGELLSADR